MPDMELTSIEAIERIIDHLIVLYKRHMAGELGMMREDIAVMLMTIFTLAEIVAPKDMQKALRQRVGAGVPGVARMTDEEYRQMEADITLATLQQPKKFDAYKLSEVIDRLQELLEHEGDITVCIEDRPVVNHSVFDGNPIIGYRQITMVILILNTVP
jgi:hypothetical protein